MPSEDADATEFHVSCPHCGEELEIYLEPNVLGTLVMDGEPATRQKDSSR